MLALWGQTVPKPTVTTTSVPDGVVGSPYSVQLSATGGTPPYGNWVVNTGLPPPGLTVNGSTGAFGGTPTAQAASPNPWCFSVMVKDSTGATSPQSAQLCMRVSTNLSITTNSLPGGQVGKVYSATLAASGGAPPYSAWAVGSGTLPPGLTLSSSGAISGTPATASGSPFTFSVTVQDVSKLTSPPKQLSIAIATGPAVTTTSLLDGVVGSPYSVQLAAAGGTPPYSNWTVNSGSPPPGLTVNSSTGAFGGVPTGLAASPNPWCFSVTVKDSVGATSNSSAQLCMRVSSNVSIITSSLPSGQVGAAYSATLAASGGAQPYSGWAVSSGTLPTGLTLNSSTGAIGGTPATAAGSPFIFSVTVQDLSKLTSPPKQLSIAIVSGPAVTTTSLLDGVVGLPYSVQLAATGGTPPYSNWTVSSGLPPPGLTVNASTGAFGGTPTAQAASPNPWCFSVTVKDSAGATSNSSAQLCMRVSSNVTVTSNSLPGGQVGALYSATLAASGGAQPYSGWAVSSGTLPPGLTLNSSTGAIGGTPATAAGSPFSFSVTVQDVSKLTSPPKQLSIAIASGPAVTTTSLLDGVVGAPYSVQLAATGGTPPYSNWTVNSGSPPPGLTVNASTGAFGGTPTAQAASPNPWCFSVTVKDSAGATSNSSAQLCMRVSADVSITTNSLPAGQVGAVYSASLAASGGTPPYTSWAVSSGALPPGLTLNSSTGAIGGMPTTATGSPFSFSVTVHDLNELISPPKQFTIAITSGLTVTTTALSDGSVGTPYSALLAATGGVSPYGSWSVAAGSLPPGLALNPSTGAIGGTPITVAGSPFAFSVTVKDASGSTSPAKPLSIAISVGVTITTISLPNGSVGTFYLASLSAAGGTPPYSNWALAGSLPPGLTLNSSTGSISGNPTTATGSPFSFSVTVKDSAGATSTSQALSITIVGGPTVSTASLPDGSVGAQYSALLAATGGIPPYGSWTLAGSLPPGLTLNPSTGAIVGTPTTTAGSPFAFSVAVKDSSGSTSPSKALTIAIVAGVTVTTTSLPNGSVGTIYSTSLAATGGIPPYSNWASAGSLPPGLTLNSSTGAISGNPTTATGSPFSFSVTVKDSAGATSPAQALTIVIATGPTIATTSLPNGSVGAPYSSTLKAIGGTPPYSKWTVTSGTLPPGLSLDPGTGIFNGSPASATGSPFSFNVKVSDSAGIVSQSQAFTIAVAVPAVVVSPTSLSFDYQPDSGIPPIPQSISIFGPSQSTTCTVAATSGGNWLSASRSSGQTPFNVTASVNTAGLQSATYNGQVAVTCSNASPPTILIPVSLTIEPSHPPIISVSPSSLSLAYVEGSPAVQRQLVIGNLGGGILAYSADAQMLSCSNWLSISPASGTATIGQGSSVTVNIDPSAQKPSVCAGQIVIHGPNGGMSSVPVTLAISAMARPTTILLSQTGLQFTAAQGSSQNPPQVFEVLNSGLGNMDWTVQTQLVPGGSDWLTITPTSGRSTAGGAGAPITVSVDPNKLKALEPGQYYESIQVTAPDAANNPQTITVGLNLVSTAPPVVAPAGLVFVGPAGAPNPAGQQVSLFNQSSQPIGYTSTGSSDDCPAWFTQTPASGSVALNQPTQMTVQANLAGLPAGVCHGTLRVGFGDGSVHTVSLLLIVTPTGGGSSSQPTSQAQALNAATSCAACPVPQFTLPEQGFSVPAQQPVTLQVTIKDSTGKPMENGIVTAAVVVNPGTQQNITLQSTHSGNGVWKGNWFPQAAPAQVNITVSAFLLQGINPPNGQAVLSGSVVSSSGKTGAVAQSVLNSASYQGAGQVAPGSWVSVFGDQLADGASGSNAPFPTQLNGTEVRLGDLSLPLYYVSGNQVNALVPSGLFVNTQHQLVIHRGDTLSQPVNVTVSDVQPGIYTVNQQGSGQGVIVNGVTNVLADVNAPVKEKDVITIYCTGLGAVNNPPPDGAPSSTTSLSTTLQTPSVTIGGVSAGAVQFSGLAPGFAGLYQVNVPVPSGVSPGSAVPVVLTLGNATSNTVTIAVK